jgi:cell wall-associated NlpC family hydrolase
MKKIILVFTSILILASCQTTVRFSSGDGSGNITPGKTLKPEYYEMSKLGDNDNPIVLTAKKWLGTPYCFGGEDKKCTDCSGFVQTVFAEIGFDIPRTAQEQYESGSTVNTKNAKPADLIFFGENDKISHVGIYIGEHYFIHSASSKGVTVQSLDDNYYKKRFVGFKRFLN